MARYNQQAGQPPHTRIRAVRPWQWRPVLLAVVGAALLSLPGMAMAQQAGPQSTNETTNEPSNETTITISNSTADVGARLETLERVVILGSHARADVAPAIRFPGALSRRELQLYGRRSLDSAAADLLSTTDPVRGMDSLLYPGNEQASALNIRGLGAGRTLVLVDGRRLGEMPTSLPGWKDAAASLGDLPSSSLAGMQVLPGGTSSLYGSGAVGGVLNLVTREPFSGIEVGFVNTEVANANQQQQLDVTFGLGSKKANFILSWEEQKQPGLPLIQRQWAREFQGIYPEYALSTTSGSPGTLTFEGQMVDLFIGEASSCQRSTVMVEDPDDPTMMIEQTIETLCGDEEVVYRGIRPLTELLPAGRTSLQVPDLYCEQLRGQLRNADCLYRYGNDLMLSHEQEDQRVFIGYTHELSPGTEMRVQYSYNTNSIPNVAGVAQRTPLNPRWQRWQVPLNNFGILPFLLLPFGEQTAEVQQITALQGLRLDQDLPDAAFFLTGVTGRAPTAEEQTLAEERATSVRTFALNPDNAAAVLTVPTWGALLGGGGPDATLTYEGNILGGAGSHVAGSRNYRRHRYVWDMQGQLGISGTFYRTGIVHDRSRSTVTERDLLVQRLDRALRGYGSASCAYEQAVAADALRAAGEMVSDLVVGAGRGGGCFYLLPLAGGVIAWDDPTTSLLTGVASSEHLTGARLGPFIQDWLFGRHTVHREQQSLQMDFLLEGGSANDAVAWALGSEYRHHYFSLEPAGFADAETYPCDLPVAIPTDDQLTEGNAQKSQLNTSSCLTPIGPFANLPSVRARKARRDVLALFTDLHFGSDNLDMQFSGRLEMDGDSGSEFAPALAFNWRLSPRWSLAGGLGQSFRFPSLVQRADLDTSAVYIDALKDYIQVQAMPAADNLAAEISTHLDLGLYLTGENSSLSVRYWQHDLTDPIVQDPVQLLADTLLTGSGTPQLDVISRVLNPFVCDDGRACSSETLLRTGVRVLYSNGPSIQAAGWELHLGHNIPTSRGQLGFSVDMSWLQQYQVDNYYLVEDVFRPAFDAAGKYNYGHPFGSLPEFRAVAQVDWQLGLHQLRLLGRHTSGYTDQRNAGFSIGAFNRMDLAYSYQLPSRKVRLSLDVSNLLDAAPPRVLTPLGYDAAQHDPYGRTLRLGVVLSYP